MWRRLENRVYNLASDFYRILFTLVLIMTGFVASKSQILPLRPETTNRFIDK